MDGAWQFMFGRAGLGKHSNHTREANPVDDKRHEKWSLGIDYRQVDIFVYNLKNIVNWTGTIYKKHTIKNND